MHTLKIIAAGLGFLALFALAGYGIDEAEGVPWGCLAFVPAWAIASVANLWVGVKKAGYSVREELPVLVVVFAVPAIVALVLWWKLQG
ncbi:MAG: hypothetical protein EOO29_35280 [Comamonadaceae bacterium]|nr:MAG: hypothetical protein EOO29_35280 [Comamonadaceae bacterium]